MASVWKKGPTWYASWKDADGVHRELATKAVTKAEAKALAVDLERQAERQRLGLEPLPSRMTFGELAQLWLVTHSKARLRSHDADEQRLRLHLLPALGKVRLGAVTPLLLDELFGSKLRTSANPDGLAPASVHQLRSLVRRIYNAGKRWRKWYGENPAALSEPIKVVKKKPVFAAAADIPPLLAAAQGEFKLLAAIAIYAGLREGEILDLKRSDLELQLGLIAVERTIGGDTTKGKRPRWVPIVAELRPMLDAHLEGLGASPGAYLFPGLRKYQGAQVRVRIGRLLRQTQVRAGLLERWDHICRRKTCREVERHPDGAQRRCSKCSYMLWPRPIPKKLTFHGLRHSYVSHLLMKGANPVAVQRMAGHATLETTLGTYGHLVPDFLRAEAERLSFGVTPKQAEGESFLPGSDSEEGSKGGGGEKPK